MTQVQSMLAPPHAGTGGHAISLVTLGLSLSLFVAVSFTVCILGYLAFPAMPVQHAALGIFLPGFTLLSWQSFLIGLIESYLWGWYIAVVFVPIYNFFDRRAQR